MLDKHLAGVLGLEFPNPARIPQLAGDAQILTAPDEGVGLAPFRGRGDAVGTEVILLTTGDRNKPNQHLAYNHEIGMFGEKEE